jgi:hypothetical protein
MTTRVSKETKRAAVPRKKKLTLSKKDALGHDARQAPGWCDSRRQKYPNLLRVHLAAAVEAMSL